MATYNGLVKLGTLRRNTTKIPRPTLPWKTDVEPYTGCGLGNIPNFSSDPTMTNWNIGDTDVAEVNQLYWYKITDGTKTLLICDRVILVSVSWDDLNSDNRVLGKAITIDGQKYKLRLLTGGKDYRTKIAWATIGGKPPENEWDRFVTNEEGISGIPTPEPSDLDFILNSTDKNSTHNQFWNWMAVGSWIQEKPTDDTQRVCRGYYSSAWLSKDSSNRYSGQGWRPVLEVLNVAPSPPRNLRPVGTSVSPEKVSTLTPIIRWEFTDPDLGDRQSAYQVIIEDDRGVVKDSGKVSSGTTSYEVLANTLRPNITYNYTVKVWDQAGEESPGSEIQYFKTMQAPEAPVTRPTGTSTVPAKELTLTPTITWSFTDPDPGDRQSAYQVTIKKGQEIVKDSGKVQNSATSYEVPRLQSNTTYNYTVRVWDQEGVGSLESAIQYFRTTQVPEVPVTHPKGTSTVPAKELTLTPTITWTFTDPDPGDRQSAYQVMIKKGQEIVKDSGKVRSNRTSYEILPLQSNTTYNYTVKVWDQEDVESPDSTIQYFTTVQAPNAPDTRPKGTSTVPTKVSLTPTISWFFTDPDLGDRQSAYQVLIKKGEEIVIDSGKVRSSTSSYEVPALQSNTTYSYTVRVWDQEDVVSLNSSIQYFKTVQVPNPSLTSPKGTSTVPAKELTLTPTITWFFTDPDPGDTQSAYQVLIKKGEEIVIDSGKVRSSTSSYEVPALQSNTTYSYTVRVWDQEDVGSLESAIQYFRTTQAPETPVTHPKGTSTVPAKELTLTPTITWSFTDPDLGDRQSAYQVVIKKGKEIVIDSGKVQNSATSYEVPALQSNTIYSYTVRVWDQEGVGSSESASQYFTTVQAPVATPISPTGTSTVPARVSVTPKLIWKYRDSEELEQKKYRVKIYKAETGEMVNPDRIFASGDTEYRVPDEMLTRGTKYYWTVEVWNRANIKSEESEKQYFITS